MKAFLSIMAILLGSGVAQARQACFYEHAGFRGWSFCMQVGESYPDLDWRFSNQISSISVERGVSVRACVGRYFSSYCRIFDSNQWNLQHIGFNDMINSLEVTNNHWHNPPRPPGHPPYNPPNPPPHRPPYGSGPIARAFTQVHVGCKGRIEQIVVDSLHLTREDYWDLYFSGSASLAHKCGSMGTIAADVEVAIPRQYVNMNRAGQLLMPVVQARVTCTGRTSWTTSACASVNFQP